MFTRMNELKDIKDYLESLKNDLNGITPDMYDFMSKLYKYLPYINKKIELPTICFGEKEFKECIINLLKHLNNKDLTGELKYFVNNRNQLINIIVSDDDTIYEYFSTGDTHKYRLYLHENPDDLIRYSGMIGNIITSRVYGENELTKTYYPNLASTFFELYMIFLYCNKYNKIQLKDDLNIERYNDVANTVWNIHAIESLSKGMFMIDYKKTNAKLSKEGYTSKITGINTLMGHNYINESKKVNTYIMSLILLSHAIRDSYTFNIIYRELFTTDNKDINQVLTNLGINYFERPSIITDLKQTPKVLKREI